MALHENYEQQPCLLAFTARPAIDRGVWRYVDSWQGKIGIGAQHGTARHSFCPADSSALLPGRVQFMDVILVDVSPAMHSHLPDVGRVLFNFALAKASLLAVCVALL